MGNATKDGSVTPAPQGSAFLANVLLDVMSRVEGRAPAVIMAEILGVSPQLARKQKGGPRRPRRTERATTHADDWVRERLLKGGLTAVEASDFLAKRPDGVLGGLLYYMFCASPLSPASMEAIRELDATDERLFSLVLGRDLDAALSWLRGEEQRRPHLFAFVDVAGCPPVVLADLAPIDEMGARSMHLAVNMLLLLLAVIDHEITPRIATEQWSGCSLVAALLAPEDTPGVCSPIAMMVDLVLALGVASVDGAFPSERPQAMHAERLFAGRRPASATSARVINSLRRLEKKFNRRALHTLMVDTKLQSGGPGQTVAEEAEMLLPLLAAAHLLTAMMPTPSARKAHPDRRGWRAAYLHWWRRHAEAQGLPTAPTASPAPPAWFTFT